MLSKERKAVAQAAIEPLITLLGSDDPTQRAAAATLLVEIGDIKAVDPLIVASRDSDPRVRREAILALANLADNILVIEPILEALTDMDNAVRKEALNVLGYNPHLKAVIPLLKMFQDFNREYVFPIKDTIKYINRTFPDGQVFDTVIDVLQNDANPSIRAGAARTLAEIDDLSAANALIGALEDNDAIVRTNAAKALTEMRTPGWKAHFLRLADSFVNDLNDVRPIVREMAAFVIEQIRDSCAESTLIYLLTDEAWSVREAAASALGYLRSTKAVGPLSLVLNDAVWRVRESAAIALGRIGDSGAVEALTRTIYDSETRVRRGAIVALWKIDDEQARKALIKAAVEHPNAYNRGNIVSLLSKSDDTEAREAVRKALDDSDEWVKSVAENALFRLRQKSNLPKGSVIDDVHVTYSIGVLKNGLRQFVNRLENTGFDYDLIKDWEFHLDELLDKWWNDHHELVNIFNTLELRDVPKLLDRFSTGNMYGTQTEIQHHMEALHKLLMKVLPEEYEDDADEDK